MDVIPPQALRSWIYDAGSFIKRLKQHRLKPYVQVLGQDWQYPHAEEARVLSIGSRRNVFVREVLIKHADRALMYARTVIPLATLTGPEKKLQFLGERTLGSVLFSYKDMERSPFEVMLFNLPQYAPHSLWGRSSLFSFRHKCLLLDEIFLPDFEDLCVNV